MLRLRDVMEVEWLEDHAGQLKKLSDFYVPLRYPDAMIGTLPDGLPGEKEAQDALQWANEICQLIRQKI